MPDEDGVVRTGEAALFSGNRDGAAIGAMDAAQNADQGRFAGAILADERMGFAEIE